ncbi:hypothetical protein Q3G72_014320 [Acer saccharum]|nr:hypothetical protein Q3G72_014320 [Acer saccharum]
MSDGGGDGDGDGVDEQEQRRRRTREAAAAADGSCGCDGDREKVMVIFVTVRDAEKLKTGEKAHAVDVRRTTSATPVFLVQKFTAGRVPDDTAGRAPDDKHHTSAYGSSCAIFGRI